MARTRGIRARQRRLRMAPRTKRRTGWASGWEQCHIGGDRVAREDDVKTEMTRLSNRHCAPIDPTLGGRPRLSMLGGFQLWAGELPITLPSGSQRLLAGLALQGRPSKRTQVAGMLWPEATEDRASARLRSSLARLLGTNRGLLDVSPSDLELAQDIRVDLDDSRALAHRLLGDAGSLRHEDTAATVVDVLSAELLPGWYDDWVLFQAEGWRQLGLHALEALTDRLVTECRYGEAAIAALAATNVDPLRESARAALIRVQLADHKRSEALREFDRSRRLMRSEFDLDPTPRLYALLEEAAPVTLR
jgi:DNA-binding SARP family transcriptional activator